MKTIFRGISFLLLGRMLNLYGCLWFLTKCNLSGHKWDEYTHVKYSKIKRETQIGATLSKIPIYLSYRVCNICGKKQIRKSDFHRLSGIWKDTDTKPKEIKTYLSNTGLDKKGLQELEEYMKHFDA